MSRSCFGVLVLESEHCTSGVVARMSRLMYKDHGPVTAVLHSCGKYHKLSDAQQVHWGSFRDKGNPLLQCPLSVPVCCYAASLARVIRKVC